MAVAPGDLVEVFVKHDHQMRGTWANTHLVLSLDREAWNIPAPCFSYRTMKEAVEDLHISLTHSPFAQMVRDENDQLDDELAAPLRSVPNAYHSEHAKNR